MIHASPIRIVPYRYTLLSFIFLLCHLFSVDGSAGTIELSAGGSYQKSTYAGGSYSSVRTTGGNFGYYFWNQSSLEFSYQEQVNRDEFVGVQSSTYHDRVLSLNWVQNFASRQAKIQPYLKGGVGQLNRDARVIDSQNRIQRAETSSVTVVGGAGLRLFMTRTLAIRGEVNSFLSGGRISSWNQNYAWTVGVSYMF